MQQAFRKAAIHLVDPEILSMEFVPS